MNKFWGSKGNKDISPSADPLARLPPGRVGRI